MLGERWRVNTGALSLRRALQVARAEDCRMPTHTQNLEEHAPFNLKFCASLISYKLILFRNRNAQPSYEGVAFKMDERERLIANLTPHKAMVLRNYGLLTCGLNAAEAFSSVSELDLDACAQLDGTASKAKLRRVSMQVCAYVANHLAKFHLGPAAFELLAPPRSLDRAYSNWRD